MQYVDIIVTTDHSLYIAPPWTVNKGDMVATKYLADLGMAKPVVEVITEEYCGEVMAFLEKYSGGPIDRISAVYRNRNVDWPDEEEQDVLE
jgi:hypothetical protein